MLKNALDQLELADRLGFDYVFEVEHHFLEEYSHSSAPEIFLAAASQRTKNMRLGHGIVLMPPRYNHPARVAERISTLDLVSDGRVEFGTGESASEMEMGGFGVRPRREEADVGRGHARSRQDDDADALRRRRGRVLRHAAAQRHPQAAAEAAPAALGRLLAPRDDDGRARAWAWARSASRSRRRTRRRSASSSTTSWSARSATRSARRSTRRSAYCPFSHASTQTKRRSRRGMEGAQFFAYSLAYYYNPFTGGNHKPGQTQHLQDVHRVPARAALGSLRRGVSAASAASAAMLAGEGAEGRGHARPLARRPARRLHRHAGLHQGHAAQVRGLRTWT